jgi:hypothetical protein
MIGEMIPAYSQDDLEACLIRKEVIGGGSSTFNVGGKSPRQEFVTLRIGKN